MNGEWSRCSRRVIKSFGGRSWKLEISSIQLLGLKPSPWILVEVAQNGTICTRNTGPTLIPVRRQERFPSQVSGNAPLFTIQRHLFVLDRASLTCLARFAMQQHMVSCSSMT
ncbi:hypothetical protein I3842_12G101600 [Carya illinoinensis]|uniref:Uncharacterized protein n=1 Tax=Carya illinoinensis TaxID=32201 RepID=A0A922DIT7_CARIL|nr:hypothetical protein I3842_12G101600 [Carya illinoinensis]